MKGLKAAIALLIMIGMIYFLNRPIQVGSQTLPPLGKFMNPQSGIWANARMSTTEYEINDDLDLLSSVHVQYDDRLVPHIFAENDRDLYYTQGYLHAKHRLWQMDLTARSTAGRLSEVLGRRTLEVDRDSRQLGLVYAAENAVKGWSANPEMGGNLLAYIEGVNKYISSLSPAAYPLEFKLLDYQPEQWTLLHSALVMKAMARTLAGRAGDARASNTKTFLGPEKYAELFPEYNPKQSPIIPKGTSWDHIEKQQVENQPKAPKLEFGYQDFIPDTDNKLLLGSNNWAVGPSKTASGSTILAGDPHLALTLPSIWYESQLNAPEQNVYGVSIAGLHGIIIGFNEHIAWSETNVGHDIIDWFEIKWANEEKTKYQLNGGEKDVVMKEEVYKIKGEAPVTDIVKYAVWGPIWEASEKSGSQSDLAMRWLSHDPQPATESITFELLNKAKNFEEYRAAISNYVSPAQNFVFASDEGDVAITVAGRLPLRADQQGRFVQPGDDIQNDWPAMIPFEHNPYVLNPERGFVSSANQVSTDTDYPYYYSSGGYFDQYRGRRLNDRLEAMNDITVDDMKDLHYDAHSVRAEEALPIMLGALEEANDEANNALIQSLKNWDYSYRSEDIAAAFFDTWYRTLYFMIWDEFDEASIAVDRPHSWKTIDIMESDINSEWFDLQSTNQRENLNDLVKNAFDSTLTIIQEKINEDVAYNWNKHRDSKILHLGRIPAFSRNEIISDGNRGTLNALSSRNGPSWRMIVEFNNGVKAWGVYPGGQSGSPGSKFYDNMIDDWAKGEYYDLKFMSKPENADWIISSTVLK